jgi:hypothetical protein
MLSAALAKKAASTLARRASMGANEESEMKGRRCSMMVVALAAMGLVMPAWALNEGTHLNPRGQSKVNKAMAKGYQTSGAEAMQKQQTQVNVGSKRAGTCTMNVGATPGSKDSKETIVTAKEIINVCK